MWSLQKVVISSSEARDLLLFFR